MPEELMPSFAMGAPRRRRPATCAVGRGGTAVDHIGRRTPPPGARPDPRYFAPGFGGAFLTYMSNQRSIS